MTGAATELASAPDASLYALSTQPAGAKSVVEFEVCPSRSRRTVIGTMCAISIVVLRTAVIRETTF